MAQLNYEIPDELHKRLKVEAAVEGITLKELIITLLDAGLKAEEAKAVFPRV